MTWDAMLRQVLPGPVALPPDSVSRQSDHSQSRENRTRGSPVTWRPEGILDIRDTVGLCPPMAGGDHYIYLGDRG